MLGQVGSAVRSRTMEWPALLEAWREGRIPFLLAGWRFENGDAADFLVDCLMTRDGPRQHGSYNLRFSHPDLDRLIEENVVTWNAKERLGQSRCR